VKRGLPTANVNGKPLCNRRLPSRTARWDLRDKYACRGDRERPSALLFCENASGCALYRLKLGPRAPSAGCREHVPTVGKCPSCPHLPQAASVIHTSEQNFIPTTSADTRLPTCACQQLATWRRQQRESQRDAAAVSAAALSTGLARPSSMRVSCSFPCGSPGCCSGGGLRPKHGCARRQPADAHSRQAAGADVSVGDPARPRRRALHGSRLRARRRRLLAPQQGLPPVLWWAAAVRGHALHRERRSAVCSHTKAPAPVSLSKTPCSWATTHAGLPEEVAHTKQALRRGYAVLAVDSANRDPMNRCFS
jgi:hypothetical protein